MQNRYAAEGSAAISAGHYLEHQLLETTASVGSPQCQKDMLRNALRGASATAGRFDKNVKPIIFVMCCICRLADLEAETRAAEMLLVEAYSKSQSASISLSKKAVHPIPRLDTYILSVKDMAWVSLVSAEILSVAN